MLKYTAISAVLLACFTSGAIADSNRYQALMQRGMLINGTVPVKLILSNNQIKNIRLMSVLLSPTAQKTLANNAAFILRNSTQFMTYDQKLPPSTYNGMNEEAVLDQGVWGTCATFATTGAINATYKLIPDSKTDPSVSQLCNLEVGVTINALPGADGGWSGSFGYLVFNQINQYGFITTEYQKENGCGGLKEYPVYSYNNGSPMSIEDFTAHSLKTFTDKDWTPILSYDGQFSPIDPTKAQVVLTDVKRALAKGYRAVFGTLIDGNVGQVGAAGTYNNAQYDTWVMTDEMQQDIKNNVQLEGHEIIIDGYDDNACATYTENGAQKTQCGLLRIRNSWGSLAGDKGDYYMSYDHFKGMAIEVYAIGQDVKDKFKPTQLS